MTREASKGPVYKLAVLASHPIQYQAPLFRALVARPEVNLHVFFCTPAGFERYRDPGFGTSFAWDTPLLGGYNHTFLRNLSPCSSPNRFFGVVNPGIVGVIRRGKYDALFIHGWSLATNWIAWAGALACGIPLFLRSETNGFTEPAGLKKIAKRTVLRIFFKPVSAFLAIGTLNASFYRSCGVPEDRIIVMPYAVDDALFANRAQQLEGHKRVLREKEGISSDLPVILYCGKFQEKKRPLDLLKAFAILSSRTTASLVFVGDGTLRLTIERFVAERRLRNVYLLGFKNQQELPACYAMADVLVLPSSFEPWGLVLNEAMCSGLPVIASDRVGAAADLIREGVNGFTYPAGNVEALADRLQRVLVDEQARMEMGRQSRAIISRWGFKEDVEGLLEALHTVVGMRS